MARQLPTRIGARRATITALLALWLGGVSLLGGVGCGESREESSEGEPDASEEATSALREMETYASPEIAIEAWQAARRANDWDWLQRILSETALREMAAQEIALYRRSGLALDALGLDDAVAEDGSAATNTVERERGLSRRMADKMPLPDLLASLEAMRAIRGDELPPMAEEAMAAVQIVYDESVEPAEVAFAELAHRDTGRRAGWLAVRRLAEASWVVDGEAAVRSPLRGVRLLEPLPAAQARPEEEAVRAEFLGSSVAEAYHFEVEEGAQPRYRIVEPGAPQAKVRVHNDTEGKVLQSVTVVFDGYDIRHDRVAEYSIDIRDTIPPGESKTFQLEERFFVALSDAVYARASVPVYEWDD